MYFQQGFDFVVFYKQILELHLPALPHRFILHAVQCRNLRHCNAVIVRFLLEELKSNVKSVRVSIIINLMSVCSHHALQASAAKLAGNVDLRFAHLLEY